MALLYYPIIKHVIYSGLLVFPREIFLLQSMKGMSTIYIMENKPGIKKYGLFFSVFAVFIFILVSEGFGKGVTVSWEKNAESNIAGYCVYYSRVSRNYSTSIDAGNVLELTISSLPDSGKMFFAVTAYDIFGNTSGYSQEVFLDLGRAQMNKRSFSLSQNYPNPFNPTTRIPFILHDRQVIELTIHNSMGQLVRLLDKGECGPGSFEIEWDGKDEYGYLIAGGVYYSRLVVGRYSESLKMTLLH